MSFERCYDRLRAALIDLRLECRARDRGGYRAEVVLELLEHVAAAANDMRLAHEHEREQDHARSHRLG